MPREGKRERERKINEQINIYFSAIKIRTIMEVRLQKKGKKNDCLLSIVPYHIHLFERANQERQWEAWHSWFQSIGVIFFWSVYFTSSLFTVPDGRVGLLPGIRVLVRHQLSTSSRSVPGHGQGSSALAPFNLQLCSALRHGALCKAQVRAHIITATCGPKWAHTHMTHPPTPTPGNLSPINNLLLPIRNIRGTVKTFLLLLQCDWLLMLYRLKAKPN